MMLCKQCGEEYIQFNRLQVVCPACRNHKRDNRKIAYHVPPTNTVNFHWEDESKRAKWNEQARLSRERISRRFA